MASEGAIIDVSSMHLDIRVIYASDLKPRA